MDNTFEEPGKYVNILLPEGLLSAIDEFRFDGRFESRTEAIRWLLRTGLDHKKAATPKKAAAKKKAAN